MRPEPTTPYPRTGRRPTSPHDGIDRHGRLKSARMRSATAPNGRQREHDPKGKRFPHHLKRPHDLDQRL